MTPRCGARPARSRADNVLAPTSRPGPSEPLADLVARLAARPAVFVASGGAMAVARLATDLHMARTGEIAFATTPLLLRALAVPKRAGIVVISARASHPDVRLALARASELLLSPVAVVTHRRSDELEPLRRLAEIVTIPTDVKDGFLATTSVLALSRAFVAASGFVGPSVLTPPLALDIDTSRDRVLVLHGPRGVPAALDLETRLSELGVASCQVTDYRNFAHGRHLGLSRNLIRTLVVAMVQPDDDSVAEATLRHLPPEAVVVRLVTTQPWPAGVVDLLNASAALAESLAKESPWGAPRKPRVSTFGRRLYHLRLEPSAITNDAAVRRKVLELGSPTSPELDQVFADALDDWRKSIRAVRFDGVVLDYDGTVCASRDRYEPPRADIQAALRRLLDVGARLAFASGRGQSLVDDLRRWIPVEFWQDVVVGLHNGSTITDLAAPPTESPQSPVIAELAARLREHPIARYLAVREGRSQLSVTAGSIHNEAIVRVLSDLVSRPPALPLKLAGSAHAVDAIVDGSKTRVLERVRSLGWSEALVIGDQGQAGGNDHDLLSATPWSLSVDRCSTDPTRCWNLLDGGIGGPTGLQRYLSSLRPTKAGLTFAWRRE